MAAARLRKAVHYPDDDDDGDDTVSGRAELDEEEQEKVISRLRRENEQHDARFRWAFTALPLVAALAFVRELCGAGRGDGPSAFARLVYLLSIASLASVSYAMRRCPLRREDRKGKRPAREEGEEGLGVSLRRNIRLLNAVVAGLVALAGLQGGLSRRDGFFGVLCLIPAILATICYLAERSMLSVNVDELEKLKYDLKGA